MSCIVCFLVSPLRTVVVVSWLPGSLSGFLCLIYFCGRSLIWLLAGRVQIPSGNWNHSAYCMFRLSINSYWSVKQRRLGVFQRPTSDPSMQRILSPHWPNGGCREYFIVVLGARVCACVWLCACVCVASERDYRPRNIWMISAAAARLHCMVLCLHVVVVCLLLVLATEEDYGLMAAFMGRVASSYESLDHLVQCTCQVL